MYESSGMALSNDPGLLIELLLGRQELTPPDVARVAGVDLEETRRLWRALGFPPVPDDAPVFTQADAAGLTIVRRILERTGLDAAVLVQLARVTGRSLAILADAQAATIMGGRGSPIDIDPALVPDLERSIAYVWRRHLLAAVRRRAERPGETEEMLTVGFADMVGFTALSQALDPADVAAMVDRFEATAYEHIPQRGGRLIKLIGDEVMFATADAGSAADIALGLVEGHAGNPDLPDVRVGLARGPTVSWEGDLFGPTVNLASRLVNVARPGAVLVSDALGTELLERTDLDLRHLRAVRLQGIGRVRSWVLRRKTKGTK
jgi:adenylate cyclase